MADIVAVISHAALRAARRFVGVTALLATSLPRPLTAEPLNRKALSNKIGSIFADLDHQGAPGASVVVVKNGQVLFKAGYGTANVAKGTPITTDTAFHLASVGKQMTGLALLMLSEKGQLVLTDPIAKYLPQFKGWGDKISIEQLLHHTSGLPDYYDDEAFGEGEPDNNDALAYLENAAHLDHRPGAHFEYSNSGYDSLAALIEKVTGRKFADFMREQIFIPAGMTNTYAFDEKALKRSKRAIGYGEDDGELYVDDTNSLNLIHGSGSIYSSADDMAKYDAALFGNRFVKEATLAQAFVSGTLNNGKKTGYGFGWYLDTDEDVGQRYYAHSGEWMGFSTYYLHYPETRLSVIVLSNSSETDAETLAFDTAHAVEKE